MKTEKQDSHQASEKSPVTQVGEARKKWQEPKLRFVKPKLTPHGKLEEITGQFFGAFTPNPG